LTHNLLKLWRAKLRLFTGQCDACESFVPHGTPDLFRCQQLPPRTEPSFRQRSSPLLNLARRCALVRRYSDRLLGNTSLDSFFERPLILIATPRNRLSKGHGAQATTRQADRHVAH
jgi:hypothetical protein